MIKIKTTEGSFGFFTIEQLTFAEDCLILEYYDMSIKKIRSYLIHGDIIAISHY